MNAKIKKILKIVAAALFLIALVINIKVTLDNPFNMVSEHAIAQTTSGPGTGTLGPVASDPSGTIYWCEGVSGVCEGPCRYCGGGN